MVMPAGSIVEPMSCAQEGEPLSSSKAMLLAEDWPGVGYWFTDSQGALFFMFQLDECTNWSVMRAPELSIEIAGPPIVPSELSPKSNIAR